ncbi:MAG: ATPase, partial [Firmicutes bacterium]|nr:ATPase [Bacillota bacterium]
GHARVGELLDPGSVASVTIAPRGQALGYVRQSPDDERLLQTHSELRTAIAVCLAGSAAEVAVTGEASTGAANDFQKAWDIARRMVLAGLSPLGVVAEEALSPEKLYDTVNAIVSQERQRVEQLLQAYRPALEALAARLLEAETLPGEVVRELAGMHSPQAGAESA